MKYEAKYFDLEMDYQHLNPGGHFFDRDTMRFFSSRLGSQYYCRKTGAYVFVTSERDRHSIAYSPRAFTVRVMDRSGWIETVGPFNEYTRSVAERMALQLARRGWTLGPAPTDPIGEPLNSLRERYEIPEDGVYHPQYEITGVDVDGKRFKIATDNRIHAEGINLWRGSIWLRDPDGTRTLLRRVWN